MSEKEQLEIQAQKYKRLQNIINQSGWKDIVEILETEYNEALDILKSPKYDKQEKEARGCIKFIDKFMTQVNADLDFGKVAQIKYVRKFINQMPNEQ